MKTMKQIADKYFFKILKNYLWRFNHNSETLNDPKDCLFLHCLNNDFL